METAEQIEALTKRLADSEANERKMQGERDSARAALAKEKIAHEESLAESQKQLELVNARLRNLVDGSMAFSHSPKSWEEALAACDNNYEAAAKAYPELRKAYNEANRH